MTIDDQARQIARWWEQETTDSGEASHARRIADAIRAAVAAERAACAKVAEEVHHSLAADPFLNDHGKASSGAYAVAAAIRARKDEP